MIREIWSPQNGEVVSGPRLLGLVCLFVAD